MFPHGLWQSSCLRGQNEGLKDTSNRPGNRTWTCLECLKKQETPEIPVAHLKQLSLWVLGSYQEGNWGWGQVDTSLSTSRFVKNCNSKCPKLYVWERNAGCLDLDPFLSFGDVHAKNLLEHSNDWHPFLALHSLLTWFNSHCTSANLTPSPSRAERRFLGSPRQVRPSSPCSRTVQTLPNLARISGATSPNGIPIRLYLFCFKRNFMILRVFKSVRGGLIGNPLK